MDLTAVCRSRLDVYPCARAETVDVEDRVDIQRIQRGILQPHGTCELHTLPAVARLQELPDRTEDTHRRTCRFTSRARYVRSDSVTGKVVGAAIAVSAALILGGFIMNRPAWISSVCDKRRMVMS